MKREIKFRVWNKDTKMFLKDFEYPCGHIAPMIRINTGELTQVDLVGNVDGGIDDQYNNLWGDNEISQFTGAKGKGDVDIYEGDIVLLHNKSKYTKEEYWFPVYKIEYYKTGFKCQYVGGGLPVDNIEFNFIHYPNNLEVIGNIYKNEDLLS